MTGFLKIRVLDAPKKNKKIILIMGPANFLEDYHLSEMPKKLQYANFKRKVVDNEIEPELILKRYRTEFPNAKFSERSVQWVHDDDVHMLYDKDANQPRFIMSDTTRPLLIGSDNVVKKFNYKQDVWTPNQLPKLCGGALLSIFKHLKGWELLACRLVCKKWARLITNQSSLWRVRNLPPFVQNYWPAETSAFRRYVRHAFLNATDKQVIVYFFEKPELFHFICSLLTGRQRRHQLKRSKFRIRVGRYTIVKNKAELWCDECKKISVQLFLDAYRQYLIL